MGSAADANWQRVGWLAGSIFVAGGALIYWAREIDVLSLGEDTAASLGVNAERSGRRVFLIAALLAAATVAAAGLVGFVGLVVPHIARRMGLRAHRPLVLAAALIGATLVVAADLAARTVAPPTELPLGAITAASGRAVLSRAAETRSMIAVSDLVVSYPRTARNAVDGVSFVAASGKLTALAGPNGSGKSSIVRALLGRANVVSGSVAVAGNDVRTLPLAELARRVAVVPQREEAAFPTRVRDYVALGRYPHLGLWRAASNADDSAIKRGAGTSRRSRAVRSRH